MSAPSISSLSAPYTPARATARAGALWHPYTVVFAALCVMTGIYWDIAWHMSIGRDTFWTPAHLLVQAGGMIAGFSSGYVALKTTFAGTDEERAGSVTFWGFRAPLGAWICIWGCAAMLASAPFDNWWHNAYGLDVKIISPPHVVLAMGIFAITIGAMLLTLAAQNRADDATRPRLAAALAITGGLFLMNLMIFLNEYSERRMMHGVLYYEVVSIAAPIGLCMLARSVRLKWPAMTCAAMFMGLWLLMMWTIGLFPATPKLGPIYQHITHMVTPGFPAWLIVPAFCIDLVMKRFGNRLRSVPLAAVLGVVFLLAFMAVQWPFADFLMHSPLARGRLFNAENFVYFAPDTYVARTRQFDSVPAGSPAFFIAVLPAFGIAVLSSWLGLWRGIWMTKVRR